MQYNPLPTLATLPQRILLSVRANVKLLYFKPHYLLLAAASSILFYELIFWFLNLGLAQYLFTNDLISIPEKISIIIGSYAGIFSPPLSPLAMTLFTVSVLQGVSIAALTYTIRAERRADKSILKSIGGTGLAGALSLLGLGCAACGTSLVTPLLMFFFSTSSVAMAEEIGFYAALIALVAAIITTHISGIRLTTKLH